MKTLDDIFKSSFKKAICFLALEAKQNWNFSN